MPTFIKTGFWEKARKGYKEWLNLDQFVESKIPASTYKVYTAIISQGGENPPVVNKVLENTIGITPIFTYTSVGQYSLEFPGLFPFAVGGEKIVTFFTTRGPSNFTNLQQGFPATSFINITTTALFTNGPFSAGQLSNFLFSGSLEIRVYN